MSSSVVIFGCNVYGAARSVTVALGIRPHFLLALGISYFPLGCVNAELPSEDWSTIALTYRERIHGGSMLHMKMQVAHMNSQESGVLVQLWSWRSYG